MADATKTVEVIFKGDSADLEKALKPLADSFDGIGDDAEKAEDALGGVGAEVEKLGGKSVAVDRLNTALKALAVALVVDRFIDVNVAAERFQKTMEFATGSTEEAAREWDYALEVANRFGLALEDTTSSYAKFIAGTSGGVLTTQELKTTFEGVAGTLSLVGSSSEDVAESLRQMTQGIGKNRFELEDLKSIAERIPGGMYAISDALGVTTADLYKMITAGEFGAEQIRIFGESLEENLNGINFDGFEQSMNRLKNTIDTALVDLGSSGVFDGISKGIQGITLSITGAIAGFELLGTIIGLQLGAIAEGDWFGESENFAQSWDDAFRKFNTSVDSSREKFLDFGDTVVEKTTDWERIDVDLSQIFDAEQLGVTVEALNEIDKAIDAALEIDTAADPLKGLTASADKATEAIAKTKVQLAEIASDERIANIEAAVTLDVAGIEASAEIAVANIESIGTAVEATTDLLGSLFGNLLDAETFTQQFLIEDQIKLQNDRLAEQDKIQQQLAEATIRELNARTRRLSAGDAIITVNGDGLQPHLEAIMFELLGAIQTKVNADGYGLLLGTP